MVQRRICISEAELRAFQFGELTEDDVEEIAEHLESCPRCEQKAMELDDLSDPVISALRRKPLEADTAQSEEKTQQEQSGHVVDTRQMPKAIGDYEILSILGQGGMGVVYEARHVALDRRVALKMMLNSRFPRGEAQDRFRVEAKAIASLQHPNIVQIFEIGECQDGQAENPIPFITLELVEGETLAQFIDNPQPPHEVAQWIESLARTIHYSHEQGIVHRDLKPANVLRSNEGTLKITDFGIAKLVGDAEQRGDTGLLIGTPEYMAPEQVVASATIGPAVDIYALGAMLYEFLTGRPPFLATTILELLELVKDQEPIPVRQIQPKVHRDLETICLKCLQKDSRRRYASAKELADDLQRYRQGEPIHARPVGSVEQLLKWVKRRPGTSLLVLSLILVTFLGLGLVTWKWREAVEQGELAHTRLIAELTARKQEAKARRLAEIAEGKEKRARKLAEAERDRVKISRYALQLFQAQRETQEGYVGRAEEFLADCDLDLREWEHRFFTALCERRIRRLKEGCHVCTAFSLNGKYLAGVAYDRNAQHSRFRGLRVWDAESGRELYLRKRHLKNIRDLAFGPESRFLISTSDDKTAIVWNVQAGKVVHTLKGHAHTVLKGRISPDGKRIATLSLDRTCRVWDATTGRSLLTLRAPTSSAEIAFSSDSQLIATGSWSADRIVIWDSATGKQIHHFQGSSDEVYQKAVKVLKRLPRSLARRAGSPDGKWIAISKGNRLEILHAKTGKHFLTLKSPSTFQGVSFSPDGLTLANTGSAMELWNLREHECQSLKGHIAAIQGMAFSPDSRLLASASEDYTVKVWEVESGKLRHTLKGHRRAVEQVAFSPDGKILASAGSARTIKVWNVDSGELLQTIDGFEAAVSDVCFDPNSHLLISSCKRTVQVWDWKSPKEIRSFKGHTRDIRTIAISSDGKYFVTASHDNLLILWDFTTGKKIRSFKGHTSSIWEVTFSPDGRFIASASWDKTVKVWNVATGELHCSLDSHRLAVRGVAFSPDGSRIATASHDKTVKLWDVQTGQELLTLRDHTQYVLCVLFSPDGQVLATAGDDLGIRLWKSQKTK